MNLKLRFRWNDRALKFIDRVPQLASEIMNTVSWYLDGGTEWGGSFAYWLEDSIPNAPEFEGDLRDIKNWDVHYAVSPPGKKRWWIGEGSLSPFVLQDDSRKYDAFSYARAKDAFEPAGRHRVWLYASNTRHRKKLRRWVRENLVSSLPESKDEAERMRNEGAEIPMKIDVDPSKSATNYFDMWDLVESLRNEQAFREIVGASLRGFWSHWG